MEAAQAAVGDGAGQPRLAHAPLSGDGHQPAKRLIEAIVNLLLDGLPAEELISDGRQVVAGG